MNQEAGSSELEARTTNTNGSRIVVPRGTEGERLDVFLLSVAPAGTTRGMIQRAIRTQQVSVDEKTVVKPGSIVHAGQTVRVHAAAFAPSRKPTVRPDVTIPLRILHEDRNLLVLDKPAGIPVHAGVKQEHPTIADALVARYPDLADVGEDPLRPGIVHRLDKGTSGVLLIARTPEMFSYLKQAFQLRRVRKEYLTLVRGVLGEDEGSIKLPIVRSQRNPLRRVVAFLGRGKPLDGARGKDAETAFRVRERFAHYTLLDVFPVTGRMHQIRVHLSHLGFPVVGDPLYGKQRKDPALPPIHRQLLHAAAVTLTLPSGKIQRFVSPLPQDFAAVLDALRATDAQHATKAEARFRVRHPRSPRRGR